MTATTAPVILTSAGYRKATRNGSNGTECAVCGKRTRDRGMVPHCRATVDGDAIPFDAVIDEGHDMGCFPVGPECAKRFPVGYLCDMELEVDE